MQQTPRRTFGVTLIELMIVVVVIAILAAIAFPSYQNYVRNAQRSDGMTALTGIALAQERHRANNTTYAGSIGALAGVDDVSSESRYNLAIVVGSATATGFSATATKRADGGIADGGCSPLTLVYAAGVTTTGPAGCWRD